MSNQVGRWTVLPWGSSPGPWAVTLEGSPGAFPTPTSKGLLAMCCPANSTVTWGGVKGRKDRGVRREPWRPLHQPCECPSLPNCSPLITLWMPVTFGMYQTEKVLFLSLLAMTLA